MVWAANFFNISNIFQWLGWKLFQPIFRYRLVIFCLTLLKINMVSTSNQSVGSTKGKHCTKRLLRKTTKQNNKWHRALNSNMSLWYFYLPVLEINLFRTSNQSVGSTKGLYFAKGLFRKITKQNNKWHQTKDLSRDYRWKKTPENKSFLIQLKWINGDILWNKMVIIDSPRVKRIESQW